MIPTVSLHAMKDEFCKIAGLGSMLGKAVAKAAPAIERTAIKSPVLTALPKVRPGYQHMMGAAEEAKHMMGTVAQRGSKKMPLKAPIQAAQPQTVAIDRTAPKTQMMTNKANKKTPSPFMRRLGIGTGLVGGGAVAGNMISSGDSNHVQGAY